MKEQEIPHTQLSDDVDAGIITQEEADKIADNIRELIEKRDQEDSDLELGC